MAVKRTRVGKRHRAWVKWLVALGVVAVLGIVFAASVGVGSWLLKKAEQYPAGDAQQEVTVPEDQIVPIKVPLIKAYAYAIGDRYSSYLYSDISHLCAPLRAQDGSLLFASRVCEHAGWDQNGTADLALNVWELHKNGLYLCTYMPISGFAVEDAVLRELVLSYEASLIVEAAESGVDEIFLTGVTPTQTNITEIVQYLRRIKSLSGDCAIGVMITPQVLLAAEHDVYLAAQLMEVCDFLVLDLRGLPLHTSEAGTEAETGANTEAQTDGAQASELTVAYVMEHMRYDLTRYSPRLALGGDQTEALDYIIERDYENWLIMGEEK
ncbi:MAG: hypothetical protein IJW70_05180 [Clostridia bacterium]|nr:hypothetical protein [Clostridia bacterium]